MKKRTILTVVVLLTVSISLEVTAQPAVTDPVKEVENLYMHGRLDDAELEALRLLNTPGSVTDLRKAEIHRILAFISIARDDRVRGVEQFLLALKFNPRMRLDRTMTSPKILEVYDEAMNRYEGLSNAEREIGDITLKAYKTRIEAGRRSLLFPGLGQFHKDEPVKGGLLIGTAGITIIGLAVSQVSTMSKRNEYRDETDPAKAADLYDEYKNIWQIRNVMGYTLAATWVIGVLDGFLLSPKSGDLQNQVSFQLVPSTKPQVGIQFRF